MARYEGPTAVGQLAIPVADLERAVAFYREVLGLKFLFQAPPGLAFFACDGVRLMLTRAREGEATPPAGLIYYCVPDLDAAYAELQARGARFEDAPHRIATLADHELWMCFLRDADGHLLGLMAERPLPSSADTGRAQ